MRKLKHLFIAISVAICAPVSINAAAFDGNARVEIADSTGGLSWISANNALTVECWFRMSIPSGQTISQNMTILANRRTGSETDPYAYLIFYNVSTGNVEFQTREGTKLDNYVLISRPYLDRWYHVAVRRSGTLLTLLVDGREIVNNAALTVGNGVANTDGVSVGGWGDGKYFWGDIQEVRIWQQSRSSATIRDYMFTSLPPSSVPYLRGYYKLGYSVDPADYYRNFAATPPTGTSPGTKQGNGTILFDEVDQAGEQSLFDARKNKGEDAIAPLSGSFSVQQTVFTRPTPGIPFALQIGYSSAIVFSSSKLGEFDPFADPVMGAGWRHSYDMRIYPEQVSSERRVLNWDGAVDTWVKSNNVYSTRHREYRGELNQLPDGDYEWVTPSRVKYRFKDPTSGYESMQGRLSEIRDLNGNVLTLQYDEFNGQLTQIADTAGGQYVFSYGGQNLLTNVSFMGWSVAFQYDTNNLLAARTLSGPAGYTNVNTRWEYFYTNRVLYRIKDPNEIIQTEVKYDTYGRKVETKDALSRTQTIEYDKPARRQMRMTDAGAKQWIDLFDRKGRLLSRSDPLGNTGSFTYDVRGNVLSRTEPLGWRTTCAYDDRSNLIAETNALGLVRRCIIHPYFNKPVEVIDALNWATYFVYDAAGNMVTNFDGIGLLAKNTYYTNGLVEASTDGNGNTSRFTYSADGFLETKTDPDNNIWRYTSNELGWPLSAVNPLEQTTTFQYDLNGRQVCVTDPLRTFTKNYDANGKVLSETDAKGAVTRYAYDAANQRTQMVDRAGNKWGYTYTSRGTLQTSSDPFGATVTRTYDDANRLVSIADPLSNTESLEYDANGNSVATVDKLGRRYTKTYDRLNRAIAETDPLCNTKTKTFDAAGRVKTVTTPNGFTSVNDYDQRGRLAKWLDAEGFEWRYAYDALANITNITDALGGHYVMAYGPRNERTMEKNQDDMEWHYVYDELLRLKQQTDPNGVTRNIEYDVGGRVDYVWFSTGRTDDYSYNDTSANVSSLYRSSPVPPTSCSFTYDVMDRVTEYSDPFSKKVKYNYDLAGRLASVTYPDNKVVTNRFDVLGRLEKQTDWATRDINYVWDKANRLVTRRYPNGITQTNAYDSAGRLTSLSYLRSSGSPLIALEYAFDRNGNKTAHLEQGTLNWGLPARIDERATYTASGRLVDRSDAFNPTNSFTYAYDASGNMTSAVSVAQSYAFTFDEDNRVLSVSCRTGLVTRTIQNRYDALGRRVSKKDNGVETRYVLDLSSKMERILCDLNSSSQITAWYVHGSDLSYRLDSGGNMTVYLADAQANVIAVADANTNLVTKYAYTPYGRLLGVSGIQSDPFRFVGSQGVMQDLPDLYFMRARYYSANAALFLSVDPVRNIGPTWRPVSYAYGGMNPMANMDPNGLLFAKIKSAISAAKKAISSVVTSVAKTLSAVVKSGMSKNGTFSPTRALVCSTVGNAVGLSDRVSYFGQNGSTDSSKLTRGDSVAVNGILWDNATEASDAYVGGEGFSMLAYNPSSGSAFKDSAETILAPYCPNSNLMMDYANLFRNMPNGVTVVGYSEGGRLATLGADLSGRDFEGDGNLVLRNPYQSEKSASSVAQQAGLYLNYSCNPSDGICNSANLPLWGQLDAAQMMWHDYQDPRGVFYEHNKVDPWR